VILLCVGALAFLGDQYARRATGFANAYHQCLNAPAESEGRRVVLSLWNVVSVNERGFNVAKVGQAVPVLGVEAEVRVGDVVSVEGRFAAGAAGTGPHVVAERFEPHPLRPAKAGLSILGSLFALLYLVHASLKELRHG
jgi:hypothetical protein